MNQWILIDNQMPEFDTPVLVSKQGTNPRVEIAQLNSMTLSSDGKGFNWVFSNYDPVPFAILYWMPLPEPATMPEP